MEKTQPRIWDTPSCLLLLGIVLFSAWRLQTAGWTEDLGRVTNVAVLGGITGLALGYSRFQRQGVIILAASYMAVIVCWQLLGVILFEDRTGLLERLSVLFGRLFTDFKELFSGKPVDDQFFVVALLCLPYWLASLFGGYHLTRHANFLKSVLPNGVLMLVVHIYHYTQRDYTWMFGAYLFSALALISRLKYLADRRKWAENRVQYSSESGLDLANTTIAAAAALILLAWGTPYILPASPAGVEFWRRTYNQVFPPNRFENVFASVEKENPPRASYFRTELPLGIRTSQSPTVVFRVFVPAEARDIPRLYWRGQIFDHYENGKWLTTSSGEMKLDPTGGDITIPDSAHSRMIAFTFDTSLDGQTILFLPSQPVWVNHDVLVLYSELPSQRGEEEEVFLDIMAMRPTPTLEAGDLYRASALITEASIAELREVGQAYPNWVRLKYLQLPDGFSPRIRELAMQIAEPYDTPYDRAAAITNYLRAEIEYSDAILLPDETVDPLEYVLFESKTGFCNYYATAEVLMLRSVGIPARLAVGYAQGEPNLQNSIYVVRERDLHAWPEVYFPEYGWVEFEPTGNQEPLERPERRAETVAAPSANPIVPLVPFDEGEAPSPNLEEEAVPIVTWQSALLPVLTWLGVAAFILLGLFLKKRFAPQATATSILKRAIERAGWTPPHWFQKWLTFINRPAIERHFHSVNLSLRLMKRPQPAHVTAGERAWILKHILPSAADSIETLLGEHEAELFTPHGGNAALTGKAALNILYKTLQRRLKILILGYNYAEVQDTPRYPL